MIRNIALSFVASLAVAVPATGQDSETQTEVVNGIVAQIESLHASLNGKTITATGAVGTLIGETLYFVNAAGKFKVQFDAGREDRRRIEGCEVPLFGDADPKCIFTVDAELSVSEPYTLADGGEVRLIIYDVK